MLYRHLCLRAHRPPKIKTKNFLSFAGRGSFLRFIPMSWLVPVKRSGHAGFLCPVYLCFRAKSRILPRALSIYHFE